MILPASFGPPEVRRDDSGTFCVAVRRFWWHSSRELLKSQLVRVHNIKMRAQEFSDGKSKTNLTITSVSYKCNNL